MTVQEISQGQNHPIPPHPYGDDVLEVLIPEDQLQARIAEMAAKVSQKYKETENDVILICVLKGAVFFITDFARALDIPNQLEFMAVSSYGNASTSSGVVRILKDLDRDIADRDVILVEDVIDSGLTLKWLLRNLRGRKPRSLEVVSLLRKPDAVKAEIDFFDIGFDLPNEFLIGYGLDYAERYRDLPFVGSLRPEVYS
ncbi:MAG: hypoxanthine phosphoribosyltransferase [Corynebacterium sp.]|nr:hypoxanthine phosphoribosyltransferase [Corynebacterium sp.]